MNFRYFTLTVILLTAACSTKTTSITVQPSNTASIIPTILSTKTLPFTPITPTFRPPRPTFDSSGIITQTPATPAQCPQSDPSLIPHLPQEYSTPAVQLEQAILDFLNKGGTPSAVVAALNPVYNFSVDLTNDGLSELVVSEKWLFVFSCAQGKYITRLKVEPEEPGKPLMAIAIKDMNGDNVPELVVREQPPGTIPGMYYQIFTWDGNQFQNVTTPDRSGKHAPALQRENWIFIWGHPKEGGNWEQWAIYDFDNNHTLELILKGGIPASTDEHLYGPWREATQVYAWNGEGFVLSADYLSLPEYRFQAVQDGDNASLAGDFGGALASYQMAIFLPQLVGWSPARAENMQDQILASTAGEPTPTFAPPDPNEYDNLASYAYYRIMLLYLVQGEMREAQRIYDHLQSEFPVGHSGWSYVAMTQAFWAEYLASQNVGLACEKAINYAATHSIEILAYLGNSTETESFYYGGQSLFYTPKDICPFK